MNMSESSHRSITSEERKIETKHRIEIGEAAEEAMEVLRRLRGQPAREGNTDVKMMEEFRLFPWTQGTMITVGTLNNVLMEFLQEELKIDERVIQGWWATHQLHWKAMLALASYEVRTLGPERGKIKLYIKRYEEAIKSLVEEEESDALGETLVESARKLGGDATKVKKKKIPKKPSNLSQGNSGGSGKLPKRGRGRPRGSKNKKRELGKATGTNAGGRSGKNKSGIREEKRKRKRVTSEENRGSKSTRRRG